MSDRVHHCPFLNRSDTRCSDYFNIEQLQHAFEHCFHAYKSCAVYQELLVERQTRRGYAAAAGAPDVSTHFVQIRLPTVATAEARSHGYAKPAA
jgi:hypothetical protein